MSDAAEDLGYQYGDYNGHSGDKEIIYRGQTTQKNGFRADAFSSYISDPGLDKNPNLKVLTHSLVRKVILDKKKETNRNILNCHKSFGQSVLAVI